MAAALQAFIISVIFNTERERGQVNYDPNYNASANVENLYFGEYIYIYPGEYLKYMFSK